MNLTSLEQSSIILYTFEEICGFIYILVWVVIAKSKVKKLANMEAMQPIFKQLNAISPNTIYQITNLLEMLIGPYYCDDHIYISYIL